MEVLDRCVDRPRLDDVSIIAPTALPKTIRNLPIRLRVAHDPQSIGALTANAARILLTE